MILFLISFILFYANGTLSKEIALTFDDAPRSWTKHFSGPERAKALLTSLKMAGVKEVAFFSNSKKLNTEGVARMKLYADHGHLIGNHTHDHPNLNDTEISTYKTSVQLAHEELSKLHGFVPWFRYPFLREGNSSAKRDAIREELKLLNYQNAYITINNYDWYMDDLYQKALTSKLTINEKALRETYLQVLMECVEFYDEMARKILGRSPKHIILLHENDLAALYVDEFVTLLKSKGWDIISPRKAYQDEIASYLTPTLFQNNPGRIGEIARDKNPQHSRQELWHKTCDEKYLDKLFVENGVTGK